MKTEDNGVTREELLAQGCTEVKSLHGRIGYTLNDRLTAVECTKCNLFQSVSSFFKRRTGFHGLDSHCKTCKKERAQKYREENSEKISEKNKIRRAENLEYYTNYGRRHREENRDYYREHSRKHRENNLEYYREYSIKWAKENSEEMKLISQRRRARKRILPDTLTADDMYRIYEIFGGCVITGCDNVHFDHVIPLAIGHGGTTHINMVPLRSDLNMSKQDRNIFEWFDDNRERFDLSQMKFDALIEYLAKVNEMTIKEYRAYVDWCFDNPRTIDELNIEVS